MQVIPTPLLMLQIRLCQEIYPGKGFLPDISLSSSPDGISGNPQTIGQKECSLLKQVKHPTQVIYSTGIAHKLAVQYQRPVSEIADEIAQGVMKNTLKQETLVFLPSLNEALQDITAWTTGPGLVHFKLSDRAIAAWLDLLIHDPLQLNKEGKDAGTQGRGDTEVEKAEGRRQEAEGRGQEAEGDTGTRRRGDAGILQFKTQNSKLKTLFPSPLTSRSSFLTSCFAIQHTHARCCSLLRLAHQEGLITLDQDKTSTDWRFLIPASIPWLLSETQLLLNCPAEQQLFSRLIAALDLFSASMPPSPVAIFHLAQEVNRAFQVFHSACSIWGSFKKSIQLAQARLGLVMAAQRILHLLMEDSLSISTPLEL